MGCWGLWVGVVPLFTGSYIHMNGQDTGHHSSPKFLSRLAPSATPWYTILAGRLNDARGVVSTLYCCLPTPMALASGGSPMFPLVVHQPASPSIWPAVQSLRRGLSTNPGATMWYVCGCS